jgi:hypothetical protein
MFSRKSITCYIVAGTLMGTAPASAQSPQQASPQQASPQQASPQAKSQQQESQQPPQSITITTQTPGAAAVVTPSVATTGVVTGVGTTGVTANPATGAAVSPSAAGRQRNLLPRR